MGFFWNRRDRDGRASRQKRHQRHLEFTILEDRQVPTIVTVTAVAFPRALEPANGRFLPVVVSGTVKQSLTQVLAGNVTSLPPAELAALQAKLAAEPTPGRALAQVTDRYRRVEPRVRAPLHQIGSTNIFAPASKTNPTAVVGVVRDFTYTLTVFLQAKNGKFGPPRQYDINVSAGDQNGGAGTTIGVGVPR
ncbi:MAG TPA: hypothetical protein VGZ22_23240 [Isosphaeraceae bacterium]|jgi:hypothetical protein|nr:hypothetical protein [Isosphaeraceae bacterium]